MKRRLAVLALVLTGSWSAAFGIALWTHGALRPGAYSSQSISDQWGYAERYGLTRGDIQRLAVFLNKRAAVSTFGGFPVRYIRRSVNGWPFVPRRVP